jgi:predicted RNA-binding protein YlqC (UPF0109 family)
MKDVLERIARALVDRPDEVEVTELEADGGVLYELRVAREDLGKVIGRQGRTARAIRAIVAAAGEKRRKRIEFEIIE